MMKQKISLPGIVFLLLGILQSAGAAWLFPTCGAKADGSWMKCHWSGQAVIGTGVILALLSIAYLLITQRLFRAGLSLSIVLVGTFNIAILNGLIGLCGRVEMQCRAVTQPAITIISAAAILLGIGSLIWVLQSEYRKKAGAP